MDDVDHVNEHLAVATDRAERLIRQRRAIEAAMPIATERDCLGCGFPIPPARLRALPATELCVECKELEEWRS